MSKEESGSADFLERRRAALERYHNVPKFSDRQYWANSADPDQTAPRGAF